MRHKGTVIATAVALIGIVIAALAFALFRPPNAPPAEGDNHDVEAAEHDEHGEEKVVRLSESEMKEFGIEVGTAAPGKLQIHATLPGEIVPDPDRLAHIVPRVRGIAREVRKNLGDDVRSGEVMAILESRELADAKSAYLAAKERVTLAEAIFALEEDLWKKNISPKQDYLQAKRAAAESRIELRAAEQKLHALGFSDDYLKKLPTHADESFTRYEMVAPFDGTVIEKHITLGEVLKDDTEAFIIADLSSVWVNLSVYRKDLPLVRAGQNVVISAGHGIPEATGAISYVSPLVGEKTRTATARVVLPNRNGIWRPGLFVTGRVIINAVDVSLVVPATALQTMDGQTCVFVETEEGFEPRAVSLGLTNRDHAEIKSGMARGQRYVTKGAFTLKSELQKEAFAGGHGH